MFSSERAQAVVPWFSSIPVALISLAVAISCIGRFGGPGIIGGTDWDNYLWAAQTAVAGKNPYLEWARTMSSLPVPDVSVTGRADLPPLQLLIYMACLRIGGPPILFGLFALTHTATAVLIDQLGMRSKRAGLSWLAWFWSAFPLFTYWFHQEASNKNIMTLLAVVVVLCAGSADRLRLLGDEKRSSAWTWFALLTATFLGNFGWLGFAAVPMIILSSGWPFRKMLWGAVIATFVTVLSHLPYAPDWKVMYSFRFSRVGLTSFHTSPLRFLEPLLGTLGIHVPLQLPLLLAAMVSLCFFAYRRPGNAAKSSALAMIAIGMLRTDADPTTILMSLIIAMVALHDARQSVYLVVVATLFYSYVTTAISEYGTLFFTFDILLPLLLPVGLLLKEVIQEGRSTSIRIKGGVPRAPS